MEKKQEKKTLAERQKQLKPGEFLKFIKVVIDPGILSNRFGSQISTFLQSLGIAFEITAQNYPGIVTWKTSIERILTQNSGNLALEDEFQGENVALVILQAEEFSKWLNSSELLSKIEFIQNIYPEKEITLLICGLNEYFQLNPSKHCGEIELETNLTKLQLLANVNHRLLNTSADLGSTVLQFTKSIAEWPYKKDVAQQLEEQNFYVVNDNKDCVAVKGTTGLSKLWQHHLIKLPLVTLETAEAIINEYPMPRLLINAYKNSSNDGPNLVADIPIRRAAGPLTSVRKIGPELSAKLYALYTSNDPDYVL